MSPPQGPEPPAPSGPSALTPEESAEVIKAVCREVVLEAERAGKDVSQFGPRCHRKYGRGALVVHFGSLEDVKANKCLSIDAWLEQTVRQSASYPLPSDGPVPAKVLQAAKAFSCDCPEGELGRRVLYRKAAKLLDQLPESGSGDSRLALETYDPSTEVCVCGEVLGGSDDNIFVVAARLSASTFSEKQEEQHRRWQAVREHAARLKSWGNEELSDREVGTELAAKTYREGLRILAEAELEDAGLELAFRLNLAEALARLGQWRESCEECSRALELEPESVKGLFRRGRARLKLGEPELARADLVRAARAAPQDKAVREALEAAKHYVAPAAAPSPAARGAEASRPASSAAAVRRLAARALPGAWRQTLLCAGALLLLGLLGRLRRRREAAAAQAGAVAALPRLGGLLRARLRALLPWGGVGRGGGE